MQAPSLGYAQQFVGRPPLQPQHRPPGPNATPPALRGAVHYRGRVYRIGFRILQDHARGNLQLIHVDGAVFPHAQPNVFQDLRAGVSAFLRAVGREA